MTNFGHMQNKDRFFIFISSRNCGLGLLWLHLHLGASSVFKARAPFIFRTWASFTSNLWASLRFYKYLQASTSFFQDLWASFQALVGSLSPSGLNLISNHNNLIRSQWCLCLLLMVFFYRCTPLPYHRNHLSVVPRISFN